MSKKDYNDEDRHRLAQLEVLLADEVKRCTDAIIAYTRHARTCQNDNHREVCLTKVCRLTGSLIDQCRYLGMIFAELAPGRVFESPAESLADLVAQQDEQAKAVALKLGQVHEADGDPSKAMDALANVKGPKTVQ